MPSDDVLPGFSDSMDLGAVEVVQALQKTSKGRLDYDHKLKNQPSVQKLVRSINTNTTLKFMAAALLFSSMLFLVLCIAPFGHV